MDNYLGMMGGPIGPMQGFTGAINLAQGLRQMQAAEQARAQAEQAAMMRQQKVQAALANPTAEGINGLALEFPDLIEPVKQYWSSVPKAKKDADLSALAGVTGAIMNGRPEIALSALKARAAADKEAGEESAGAEALIAMIEGGQLEQAKGLAALLLGAGAGEDAVKTILSNLTEGKVVSPGSSVVTGMSGEVFRAPDAPKYMKVEGSEGEQIVEVGGTPGAGPMAALVGGMGSRAARNNNPGNIRDSEFAKSQPGYAGTDGSFAKFETPEAGAAAQGALLASYMDRGFNSVGKIISRWAPPSDGNDTSSYIKTVADRLGVKPAQPLSKADIPRLQAAISQVEGGASSGGGRVVFDTAGEGEPDNGLTGQAYLDSLPASKKGLVSAIVRGDFPITAKMTSPQGLKLFEMAARVDPTISAATYPKRVQTMKDFSSSGKSGQAITSIETLANHLYTLAEASEELGGTDTFGRPGNWIANQWMKQSNNPSFIKYQSAIDKIAPELDKFLSGKPATVSGQQEARESFNINLGPAGRRQAIATTIELILGRLGPLGEAYTRGMDRNVSATDLMTPDKRQRLEAITDWAAGQPLRKVERSAPKTASDTGSGDETPAQKRARIRAELGLGGD